MVTGPTSTPTSSSTPRIIPNELSISDERRAKEIVPAISKLPGRLIAVVTIDKPYLGEEMQ